MLLAFCFPGCAPVKEEERPRLVVLTTGGTIRKAVDAAIDAFQAEHPGVEVEVVSTPGKDYYKKSLTMLAGRAHVDLLWLGQGFGMFASRGALLDLEPFLKADPAFDLAAYQERVVGWYRSAGALFGVPYGVDTLCLAYNSELFDAAALPYPSADWTLEEMLASARRLTRFHPGSRRVLQVGLGFSELDFRYYGLSLIEPGEARFGLQGPRALEWMEDQLRLLHEERILQRGTELEAMDRLTGFHQQQVAMVALATWELQEMRQRAPFRWGLVDLPMGKDGKRQGWASSAGFSIAKGSRHPQLAWELLKHLTNASFQRQMMGQTIPVLKELRKEYLAVHPAPPEGVEAYLRMVEVSEPNPRIAAFPEVEAEWNYWKERAFLRQIPPQEALSKAKMNIERILALHHDSKKP